MSGNCGLKELHGKNTRAPAGQHGIEEPQEATLCCNPFILTLNAPLPPSIN